MEESKQKEYLSIAYLRALASKAGALMDIQNEDGLSDDATLKKHFMLPNEFDGVISIQLKSTNSINICKEYDNHYTYVLSSKNYNDLVRECAIKRYLAVLILSKEDYLKITPEQLVIKKCMYYISLTGKEKTDNFDSITIEIPKENILNSDKLNELLEKSND